MSIDKPTLDERYATAVNSSNLNIDARTAISDTDVLSAFGIAARTEPLAVALKRLFAGDDRAVHDVVRELTAVAWYGARALRVRLDRIEAFDMARACVAWQRNGTCRECGGHGFELIAGTRTHSERRCPPCRGSGKLPFEKNFPRRQRELAAYLVAEMQREMGRAGPEAMKILATRLEL